MLIENVFFILIGLWLLILSAVLIWIFNHFRRLTKQVKKGDLIKLLDKILHAEAENSKNIKTLEKEIKRLDLEGLQHVQKVGLVRFNPFREMGGDHSFALCLLNGEDDGVVITGLHTRERTRVYMKQVNNGESELDLSNDEKRALKKALTGK